MKTYYTLALLEEGTWVVEFGDYDKSVVKDEWQDYRNRGYKAKHLKIISSGDNQKEIEAEIAKLNEEK